MCTNWSKKLKFSFSANSFIFENKKYLSYWLAANKIPQMILNKLDWISFKSLDVECNSDLHISKVEFHNKYFDL